MFEVVAIAGVCECCERVCSVVRLYGEDAVAVCDDCADLLRSEP